MNWKVPMIALFSLSALTACQAEQQTTDDGAGYEGVENTRFERMADDLNETNNTDRAKNGEDQGENTDRNYKVADKAADKIEQEVKGVKGASVLKTENNAYVAARLENEGQGEDVSDQMEREIIKVVKGVDENIDHVYVSANPDFVDLTNRYAENVENGEPVEGFFRQFGEMVDRIFPDADRG